MLASFWFLPTVKNKQTNKKQGPVIQQAGLKNKNKQKQTHKPHCGDRGLIWRRHRPTPYGALRGAAEHPSPLGPALLGGYRRRVVIVLGGGRVPVAITLLRQRFYLFSQILHPHVELFQLLDGPATTKHTSSVSKEATCFLLSTKDLYLQADSLVRTTKENSNINVIIHS